jgi:hypothetical protein
MGILHYDPTPMTEEEAEAMIAQHTATGDARPPYFDYVKGRVMKVRLKDGALDPRLYDRDNGEGGNGASGRQATGVYRQQPAMGNR